MAAKDAIPVETRIRELAEAGLTDEEIAAKLDLTVAVVAASPALIGALDSEAGKKAADERVRRALYKRAVGFMRKDVVVTKDDGAVDVYIEVPPDVPAQTKWLEVRDPKQWGKNAKVEFDVGATLEALLRRSLSAPAQQLPDARVVSEQ